MSNEHFFGEIVAAIAAAEREFAEMQTALISRAIAANDPSPPRISRDEKLESLFAALPPRVELKHKNAYSPVSKYFAPIDANISFPIIENVTLLFSYNSIQISNAREHRADYVEMLERIALAVKRRFVDKVTRKKLRFVFQRLHANFPLLQKAALVLHFRTEIEMSVLLRIFFKVARVESDENAQSAFFAFATSFCKVCRVYLCDYHYPADAVKGVNVRAPDNHFAEKAFYLDRLDPKQLHSLAAPADFAAAVAALGVRLPAAVIARAEKGDAQVIDYTERGFDVAAVRFDPDYRFGAREVRRQSFLCQIEGEFERLRKGCACTNGCPKPENGKRTVQACSCLVQTGRECVPNVCRCNCGYNPTLYVFLPPGAAHCKNVNATYRVRRRLRVRPSGVCLGFGLFTDERLQKGDFIGCYLGEFLTRSEESLQDAFSKLVDASYLFTVKTAQFSILDAYHYGNVTRFINHMPASVANVEVKEVAAGGARGICFFANRAIPSGEELFFDYGKEYVLKWKTDFDAKIARYVREKRVRLDKLRESRFLNREKEFFNKIAK